ncbi:nischarin [Xenopus tropicalis]|uniref:LOC100170568 protein n=1 Tax=Xenopus tropicalis TaxID=8364 RepID=B3DLY1_XENTR|nr:nischarin [Xenopus tropicalis]AAI67624.1 LOC100170568 protein [Xenopus tropicalis]|eukprot:NP_001123817.1 nischarin [Xenopus tropicalis]
MIGKNSRSLVEKRQKDLELYLQTLLGTFPLAVPKALARFLHFHLYEIHGIAAVLAEELFHKGEQLLLAGEVFTVTPLQLYAVTQLLRRAKPTCSTGDARNDLGHIMDFACRLKYLRISGRTGPVGTSNIHEQSLPCDLSIFKSLCQIEVSQCNARLLSGLTSCRRSLATISIHCSASSMKDILVPEAYDFEQWEPEGVAPGSPITAVVPKWKVLTTLDLSHNRISCIDESVKLIPEIEFLDFSHNDISTIENLQHLYNLIHLDLSYNKLADLTGIYTKVGNIKTLSLAGNVLESLRGLNKLYSLVNLDLSQNRIEQLEEVRNIGGLPCLEGVLLAGNPLTVIPDYRTKVLALFGDRASEVCLDSTRTTEKELDTVEVLKAIQKSRDARNKLASSEKKINEELRPSAAGSSSPARASSSSLSRPISCSQGADSIDLSLAKRLSPGGAQQSGSGDPAAKQEAERGKPCEGDVQRDVSDPPPGSGTSCREDAVTLDQWGPCPCMSLYQGDKELLPYISVLMEGALREPRHVAGEAENKWGPHSCEFHKTEDGYFEMGPDTQTTDGTFPAAPAVSHIVWGLSFHSRGAAELRPFASCLVLTDTLVVCFELAPNSAPNLLRLVLCFAYGDVAGFHFPVPDICLRVSLGDGEESVFVMSDLQGLQQLSACLKARCPPSHTPERIIPEPMSLQDLLLYISEVQQVVLSDSDVKGCFPVYLLNGEAAGDPAQPEPPFHTQTWPPAASCAALLSIISTGLQPGGERLLPHWLLLTQQCFILITVDISTITGNRAEYAGNALTMSAIPLASVALEPESPPAENKPPQFAGHTVPLMVDYRAVSAFFVVPQNKFHFLSVFNQLRKSLQGIKNLVICKSIKNLDDSQSWVGDAHRPPTHSLSPVAPHRARPPQYPSESLTQRLSEENHIPFYLPASASLRFIAELKGKALVELFRSCVAEAEGEELRHLTWASLLLYGTPDTEFPSCILLSTQAVYFLLDDTQNPKEQGYWRKRPARSPLQISFCFAIKFSSLQSVNIGLFDQYFRITGSSPSQVVTCLTRDSYSTHSFIQQLMSALSLLARAPSPEPLEKDFYSEFGTKNTGRMENYELIHSSRVKFVYPNEEEMGDLTFIVSEKMDPSSPIQSLNILLYVLGFRVSCVGRTDPAPSLQPNSLILTSSDLFLFNEDYISYPLPDFAKEPPKKDKYQLVDGRRIRDLDRVLMGYQTYPQNLTLVFDDVHKQDFMHSVSLDHFGETLGGSPGAVGANKEIQWNIFIPSADSREKLISLLARQWESLCGRELPIELTG